jgi:hypothetical protein
MHVASNKRKEDPQALEERSYTSTTYPTTGAVFTEVQKLEKLMNTFILNQAMPDDQYDEEKKHQEFRVDSNGKILRKKKNALVYKFVGVVRRR